MDNLHKHTPTIHKLSLNVFSDNDFKHHLNHLQALYTNTPNKHKHNQEQLAYLKDIVAHSRYHAENMLITHKDGCKVAQYLSSFQDKFIHMLYQLAEIQHMKILKPSKAKLMVAATGGYGRGMLAPYSDIDLLFIIDNDRDIWIEAIIERIQHWLWDLGFHLGHAVRTLQEVISYAKTDMVIRTSILETRYITGEKILFTQMNELFSYHFQQKIDPLFINSKLEERKVRHEKTGISRYLVEPDIKNGKGGLRDLYSLFWIAKYAYKLKDSAELVKIGLLNPQEWSMFCRCEKFLWTIRLHLHFISQKANEKISFDVQPILTKRLSYKSRKGLRDVERFMKQYFFYAKNVGDLTRILCSALEEKSVKSQPIEHVKNLFNDSFFHFYLDKNSDFFISTNRIRSKNRDIFHNNPINFIRLFHITSDLQLDMHPETLHLAMRNRFLINQNLRDNTQANSLFLDILTELPHPEISLRRMHEAGILSKFIPEFEHVLCLMQFNMYHHYTVDEHLLRAIGILSALEKDEYKHENPVTTEIVCNIRLRRALYIAVLLHDIAKGYSEDHSIKGAKIAKDICARFLLGQEETDTVCWLVLHHLLMNNYAQKRDLNDPKTITDFTHIVDSQEKLDLLTVLTVCDIRAVGPGVWNGWKGTLLRVLYNAASAHLADNKSLSKHKTVLDIKTKFLSHYPQTQQIRYESHLKLFPDNYFTSVTKKQFDSHITLLEKNHFIVNEPIFKIQTDSLKSISIITILVPASAKLLLILASCCAFRKHNIVDAELFTLKNGISLITLYLKKRYDDYATEIKSLQILTQNIDEAFKGKIMILDKLKEYNTHTPPLQKTFDFVPKIHFHNDWSDDFSVVEITCLDAVGLLSIIAHAFFRLNIEIHSAKIMTLGERVIDTFYIHDLTRHKIYKKERIITIQNHLLNAIKHNHL